MTAPSTAAKATAPDWLPNKDYDNEATWPPRGHPLAGVFHDARLQWPDSVGSRERYAYLISWLLPILARAAQADTLRAENEALKAECATQTEAAVLAEREAQAKVESLRRGETRLSLLLNDRAREEAELAEVVTIAQQREVQNLHAGISRRDWHATERAANELRDRLDRAMNERRGRARPEQPKHGEDRT